MCDPVGGRCWSLLLFAAVAALLSSRYIYSQTSSTGALAGVTLDPYDAVLPAGSIHLTTLDGNEAMAATSDEDGRFGFFLLSPGTYEVRVSKLNFKPVSQRGIQVHVTETLWFQLHLELAIRVEQTQVISDP